VVRLSIILLIQEVNDLINEGWEPYGSLVSTDDEYLQPMVRYTAIPSTYRGKPIDVPITP